MGRGGKGRRTERLASTSARVAGSHAVAARSARIAATRSRLRAAVRSLGSGFELLALDPAQLKQPNECFLDQVVRTRCAGRDANIHRTRRQPEMRNDFALFVQVVVLDLGRTNES